MWNGPTYNDQFGLDNASTKKETTIWVNQKPMNGKKHS